MPDVAEMLTEAVVKGGGTRAVAIAEAVAPSALLGIGLQTGIEFALQYPEAATTFLKRVRESEESTSRELGVEPTGRPQVCQRMAAALFSIVEGAK